MLWIVISYTGPLFYINSSPSIETGLYIRTAGEIKEGDTVVYEKLIKKVGHKDAKYTIDEEGLHVEEKLYKKVIAGIRKEGKLNNDECLLIGEHIDSYDSRYFGPVKLYKCKKVTLIW